MQVIYLFILLYKYYNNRKLKDFDQENRETVEKYNQLNLYGDINTILAEKEKFENLYKEETKKNHEQKIFIDTQKRLINSIGKGGSNSQNSTKLSPLNRENSLQKIPSSITSTFKARPYTTGLF